MHLTRRQVSAALGILAIAPSLHSARADAASDSLDASHGVVFSGASSRLLVDEFFSREDPIETWDPSAAEISHLEAVLGPELRHRLGKNGGRAIVRDYFRQYAGIHLSGRKLIFVSGFHRSYVEETIKWLAQPRPESELRAFPTKARSGNFWHFVPVRVSDGGDNYFEAIYDPTHMMIVGFQFNGLA
jgi:hypothetical protein